MDDSAGTAGELLRLRDELERARRECQALAERVHDLQRQLGGQRGADRDEFEEAFRVEQSRAKRLRQALCLALLELDNVQELRDRLSHAAGEDALAHLHATLHSTLRPSDVVSRLDGPEFAILLTATTLEQGLAAAGRLQQAVAAHPYPVHGRDHALSVSIGLAQWRADEPLGDLLSRASRALGLARRGGPGKVVVG